MTLTAMRPVVDLGKGREAALWGIPEVSWQIVRGGSWMEQVMIVDGVWEGVACISATIQLLWIFMSAMSSTLTSCSI